MEMPGEQMPFELPMTLGHENTGWVAELGAGVSGLEVGEPVAVYLAWGCGRCDRCRRGMARARMLDVPGHERRRRRTGRPGGQHQ